ncbi:MAG: flavodoxin family protein [Anaerolineae bacterium]|nr:flavodoxin family protein [Anaerolineae bacterium]
MSNRVLVFLGSPRKRANSTLLADQIAAGAQAAGSGVETFGLHEMDIRPCRACEGCHRPNSKGCVIDDDMQALYPKLREADALVIASPVYWFTVSAQTKLLMDRWYALEGPQGSALRGKRIAIALTYGDSDPFTSGAVNALRTFQDAFRYVGADILGAVYGTASREGEIADNQALMERAYRLGQQLVTPR